MKKSTEYILVISMLLLAATVKIFFWHDGVFGADALYHYTVVEQAMDKNKLSNDNNLALCYEGIKNGHPYGYYILPFILGKIIGLEKTFILLPVFLSLITLAITYLLLKKLFNRRVALTTIFFLAISIPFISKSFPFSWRGENIIYPFLLTALLCMVKFLFEKKRNITMAIGAGISSGLTIWFWNGYPLVMITYFLSLGACLGYKYITKDKELIQNIKASAISVGVQALAMYSIFFTAEIWEKGYIFAKYYYPVIGIGVALGLGSLYLARKKETIKPLVIVASLGLVALAIWWPEIKNIIVGFGSIHTQEIAKVPELQKLKMYQYFFAWYLLCFTSIAGIIPFIKKFDAKKALFLGWLVPAVYLLFSAARYVFFASIPTITLSALFLAQERKIKKKFDLFIFLTYTIMIIMLVYSFYAIPIYYKDNEHIKTKEPYLFLKENTDKEACILELSNQGAVIEYFAKRYYFFHSLGSVESRTQKAAEILIKNKTEDIEIEKFYILLNYADITKINLLNLFANNKDIGFYRMASNVEEDLNKTELRDELDFMRYIYVENTLFTNETGSGCAYFKSGDAIYLQDGVCNTNLFQMIVEQPVNDFRKIYSKDGFVIYKYEPTNTLLKKE